MKQFTLYLDTTTKEVHLILINDNRIIDHQVFLASDSSENQFIEEIDRLLKKNHLKIGDIDNVIVNTGPGSFTGTRVGVAFANALKLAQPKIRLFDVTNPKSDRNIIQAITKKDLDLLSPSYYSAPSITKPK